MGNLLAFAIFNQGIIKMESKELNEIIKKIASERDKQSEKRLEKLKKIQNIISKRKEEREKL